MLSTQYRLRLEAICEKIVLHEEVSLEDMIWAEELAKSNRSAATILRLDTHSAPSGGEVENQTLGSRLSTAATWDLSPNNAAPAPAGAATALADEGLTGGWREIVHLH